MKGYYTHGDYYGYVPSTREYRKFPTPREYEEWYAENYERGEEA